MKDIKIFVSHRIDFEAETVSNDVFVPVHCGAVYMDEPDSMAGDNTGENISERRNSFCELTVQYWAWKNVKADYYGICHYRRYFSFAEETMPEDSYTNVIDSFISYEARSRYHLDDMAQIEKIVDGNDIVATVPFDVKKVGNRSIEHQYVQQSYLDEHDLVLLREAVGRLQPEYVETLEETLAGKDFYPCNMFIMKRETFQEYCDWIFSILFEVERHLDMTEANSDRLRAIGHIGERLLTVFINHKRKQQAKIRILQRVVFKNAGKLDSIPKISDEYIPVVFSSSQQYLPYLYVTIFSMLQKVLPSEKLDIIVLHNGFTDENKKMLLSLAAKHANTSLRFYNVEPDVSGLDFEANAHISVDTFYRLFVPRICKEYDKILYLDSDLLVCHDIRELYDSISDDRTVTATLDADFLSQFYNDGLIADYSMQVLKLERPVQYFQAGVMAFNLKLFRERYDLDRLLSFALSHKFKYLDQDIMNAFFRGDIHFIDMSWNVLMDSFEERKNNIVKSAPAHVCQQYMAARRRPRIIHYAGGDKPWFNPSCDYAAEFWEMARLTPVYELILFDMANRRAEAAALYIEQKHNYTRRLIELLLPSDKKKRQKMKKKLNTWVSLFAPQGSDRREILKKMYHKIR